MKRWYMKRWYMKRTISTTMAAAVGLLALGAPLPAQQLLPNQFALDGAIGIALPLGGYGAGLTPGLDLMAAVEYRPLVTWPVYFRAELGWDHFSVTGAASANSDITRVAVDGMYEFVHPRSVLQPYVLGGIGIYRVSMRVDRLCGTDASGNFKFCRSSSSGSDGFGINLGGGVRHRLGRLAQAYLEVRYQLPLTGTGGTGGAGDSPFVPLQFGVRYLLR